jgi:hypothetical protein
MEKKNSVPVVTIGFKRGGVTASPSVWTGAWDDVADATW